MSCGACASVHMAVLAHTVLTAHMVLQLPVIASRNKGEMSYENEELLGDVLYLLMTEHDFV